MDGGSLRFRRLPAPAATPRKSEVGSREASKTLLPLEVVEPELARPVELLDRPVVVDHASAVASGDDDLRAEELRGSVIDCVRAAVAEEIGRRPAGS